MLSIKELSVRLSQESRLASSDEPAAETKPGPGDTLLQRQAPKCRGTQSRWLQIARCLHDRASQRLQDLPGPGWRVYGPKPRRFGNFRRRICRHPRQVGQRQIDPAQHAHRDRPRQLGNRRHQWYGTTHA